MQEGLPPTGLGMVYVLMLAELERVAISGVTVGKQRTYAAFDERVPPSPPRPRQEALAELAARYLGSRGPATDRDFASWSGFTLTDCRRAIADAVDASGGRLESVEVDGAAHWFDAEGDRAGDDRRGQRRAARRRPAAGLRRVHLGLRGAARLPLPARPRRRARLPSSPCTPSRSTGSSRDAGPRSSTNGVRP